MVMTQSQERKNTSMNNRLFLYSALAFICILLYEAWSNDYSVETTETKIISEEIPETKIIKKGESIDEQIIPVEESVYSKNFILVKTDNHNIKISLADGSIIFAELLNYPVSQDKEAVNIQILDTKTKHYIAKVGAQKKNEQTKIRFTSNKTTHDIAGKKNLDVILTGVANDGTKITKTYSFNKHSHLITVTQQIENTTPSVSLWRQFNSIERGEGQNSNRLLYTYTGAAYYDNDEKFIKVEFDEISETNLIKPLNFGWISMLEHYFLTAWIPYASDQKANTTVYTKFIPNGGEKIYLIGSVDNYQEIEPNSRVTFVSRLFVGPKNQNELNAVSENLVLTVDYGALTFLAAPLFWILEKLYFFIGNWGWAIVFLTILIKLVFFKLSETSYRSMAKMKKLTPRMQSLKERFGEDKKKYSEALMRMYKEEKVNPLGGCLPILIQIPVFIALYWVLIESVEMRQAPFIAWISDLSSADPLYILPIAMGVSMYIQQKLNPTPVEPMQQKIFMFLPIIFTFLFATFPSGLVLYWLTNNILSIGQQYVINKRVVGA